MKVEYEIKFNRTLAHEHKGERLERAGSVAYGLAQLLYVPSDGIAHAAAAVDELIHVSFPGEPPQQQAITRPIAFARPKSEVGRCAPLPLDVIKTPTIENLSAPFSPPAKTYE